MCKRHLLRTEHPVLDRLDGALHYDLTHLGYLMKRLCIGEGAAPPAPLQRGTHVRREEVVRAPPLWGGRRARARAGASMIGFLAQIGVLRAVDRGMDHIRPEYTRMTRIGVVLPHHKAHRCIFGRFHNNIFSCEIGVFVRKINML